MPASKDGVVKSCSKCGLTKPMEAFANQKGVKDGKQYYCLECSKQSQKQEYAVRYRAKVKGQRQEATRVGTLMPVLPDHLK